MIDEDGNVKVSVILPTEPAAGETCACFNEHLHGQGVQCLCCDMDKSAPLPDDAKPQAGEGLLPCPFCGAPALSDGAGNYRHDDWTVRCTECRANTGEDRSAYDTEAEAIAAWNRRSEPAAKSSPSDEAIWMLHRLLNLESTTDVAEAAFMVHMTVERMMPAVQENARINAVLEGANEELWGNLQDANATIAELRAEIAAKDASIEQIRIVAQECSCNFGEIREVIDALAAEGEKS